MADREALDVARTYWERICAEGIRIRRLILFGSFARGTNREWSDIDLMVVLDDSVPRHDYDRVSNMLWRIARAVDTRIEPLAVYEEAWLHDEVTPIILVVREEGVEIAA